MKIETSAKRIYRTATTFLVRPILALAVLAMGCGIGGERSGSSSYQPPSIGESIDSSAIQARIETPAGTTGYNPRDPLMVAASEATEQINFLPYPGNFGFVLGCARIDSASGHAIPLPVIVLMPALSAGSVLAIRPIAVLSLRSEDASIPVVVAIPVDPGLRSVQARNFVDLITEYDPVRAILQTWFLNYLGHETFELAGWHDERYAQRLISEWKISE